MFPDHELAVEAMLEASRHGHPVHDLLYAVLARREGYSVLTFDRRLASLFRKPGIGVSCPVSAALFFGSLVPLSLQHGSKVILPVVYGFGTALPVVALALVATGGTKALGAVMNGVGTFELWARRITGAVFVAVGIYLSVRFVFLG